MRKRNRRTAQIDHGLRAIASIVGNLRSSIGQIDNEKEDEAIKAAIRWIYGGTP